VDATAGLHPLAMTVDADGRVTWLSDAFARLCADGGDVIGRPLRDALPKLPRPEQSFEMMQQLADSGLVVRAPVDVVDGREQRHALEISIVPLRGVGERAPLQLVIGRSRDDVLPCEGDHAMLDGLPDAVLCVDRHGFVAHVNPVAERLLARSRDVLLGAPAALLARDGVQLEQLLLAMKADAPRRLDLTPRLSREREIPVDAHVAPHPGRGVGGGVVISLRDASQNVAAGRKLARRNDELERCVTTLAHDLRSPLVALLGFSRLLRQDYGERLDETGAHFIDRIEQAGRTMEALIHDLLELSRIGRPGERPAMVDARAVLVQLAAELKARLDLSGITLEIPEDPPLVYCDRTRLYQVFSNLIGNAIEHMGDAGDPRIVVEVEEETDAHRLTVRDFGRGVAAEHHQKIFEVFHSLERRREGRRGTGMGLAIVRKIAETHGGRAWVESEPGRGAAFHVTLPRH
jgi:signal transduction histidine kinase